MPPRITRVRWSAQGLPWGIQFNERTGTFSGTPEDAGEYIVPVTVETNYGTDTKDVKIVVEPPLCNVYAIGQKAATWAEGNEPDSDGFYALNMPKANKLVAHYEGFGAITADKTYYCCGVYDTTVVNDNNLTIPQFMVLEKPTILDSVIGGVTLTYVTRVICGDYSYYYSNSGSYSSTTVRKYSKWVLCWMESSGRGYCHQSGLLNHTTNSYRGQTQSSKFVEEVSRSGYTINASSIYTPSGDDITDGIAVFGDAVLSDQRYASYLYKDGMRCSQSGTTRTLQEKAIKMFYPMQPFLCLTESGSLYNYTATALTSCSYGSIKNAWGAGATAFYVQTEGDFLCQYENSSQDWNLLGVYDIKKVEVPSAVHMFMLTNDGELYHKGNAITGLFDEAHTTLTRIFPTLTFKDFTFGGNTLTVLRE